MKGAENVDAWASTADIDNKVDTAARPRRGTYPYASIPLPGKKQGHLGPKVLTNHRERFTYILIALGAAVYLYPFLQVLWRIGDEGTLVYGTQRVAQGAVPYRDFFEVMGPGNFYWLGFSLEYSEPRGKCREPCC